MIQELERPAQPSAVQMAQKREVFGDDRFHLFGQLDYSLAVLQDTLIDLSPFPGRWLDISPRSSFFTLVLILPFIRRSALYLTFSDRCAQEHQQLAAVSRAPPRLQFQALVDRLQSTASGFRC